VADGYDEIARKLHALGMKEDLRRFLELTPNGGVARCADPLEVVHVPKHCHH